MSESQRSAEARKLFKPTEYKLIDEKVVKFKDVKVHEFTMGDVDDPDIYAGQHIYEWQESDAGTWIMEHAAEAPFWHRQLDVRTFGHRYSIIARLNEADELFWRLKWAKS
jgi:hypothetical protein